MQLCGPRPRGRKMMIFSATYAENSAIFAASYAENAKAANYPANIRSIKRSGTRRKLLLSL